MIAVGLGVLATLQVAWCLVYVTSAWRSTPLGWVWLLKGGALGVVWTLLLVHQVRPIPDGVWVALLGLLIVATGIWLWVTIQARFGKFAPYL